MADVGRPSGKRPPIAWAYRCQGARSGSRWRFVRLVCVPSSGPDRLPTSIRSARSSRVPQERCTAPGLCGLIRQAKLIDDSCSCDVIEPAKQRNRGSTRELQHAGHRKMRRPEQSNHYFPSGTGPISSLSAKTWRKIRPTVRKRPAGSADDRGGEAE